MADHHYHQDPDQNPDQKQDEYLLGKSVAYPREYDPTILQPIERATERALLGIKSSPLPFYGVDIWTCYELCWLDQAGKPQVGIGEITVPCDSLNIIESKSLKLYLNSLNEQQFASVEELKATLRSDLQKVSGTEVAIEIFTIDEYTQKGLHSMSGLSLDDIVVASVDDQPRLDQLVMVDSKEVKEEVLYSHLLKSNCPVTGQPDWASVQIGYRGKGIEHQSLLAYVLSFRHHQAFHEQCVEKIFMDIKTRCKPERLTVVARYTRRGGLDINPWRSTSTQRPESLRLGRQ